MKRIIIKEHAEHVNDIQRAIAMIPKILEMDNGITVTPSKSDTAMEVEITANTGESNVSIAILATLETTGGELERERTYDSPEEYADTDVTVVSIDEVHYSEEFEKPEDEMRGINGIEIVNFLDNAVLEQIEKFLYKYL